MHFTVATLAAIMAGAASAQTLNIPAQGAVEKLSGTRIITGTNNDMGGKEFDLGITCNPNEGGIPVFRLRPGAVIENAIIGVRASEGIHCDGACTIKNVWFRDVCEDAITLRGTGPYTITGGGAQNGQDKVVQHNGEGLVTISDFTVVNSGKLYRSCGDCGSNNGQKRDVTLNNIRARGITSDLVGINSNYGDVATINSGCGSNISKMCQEFIGVNSGKSDPVGTTANCRGQFGTKFFSAC